MQTHLPLDHVQVIGHVLAATQAGAGTPGAAAVPREASTTHYGADGVQVATLSTTSYAGVRLGDDGHLVGGRIEHTSTQPDGTPVNSSTVDLGPHGRPTTVQTAIHNRFREGVAKTVQADLSGVQWTAAASIHAGTAAIRVLHSTTEAVRTEGRLSFADEQLVAGHFAHHDWAGDGRVDRHTEVDYRSAAMVGLRLVGGWCGLSAKDAAGVERSRSHLFLAPEGHLLQVHSENLDPATATLRSAVIARFDDIEFTAGGQLSDGDAHYLVTDPRHGVRSRSVVSFRGGRPVTTVTQAYRAGAASSRILTDYAGATFDNDLKVVDSQVTSTLFDRDGNLVTRVLATYDANGAVVQRSIEKADATIQVTDVAPAPRRPAPPAGYVPEPGPDDAELGPEPTYHTSTSTTDDGQLTTTTTTIRRSDHSVLRRTVTQSRGGVAVASAVTDYASDGTVTSTDHVDLHGLQVDATTGAVTGQAKVESKFRGRTPSSSSVLTY